MTDYASDFNTAPTTPTNYAADFATSPAQTAPQTEYSPLGTNWQNLMAGVGQGATAIALGAKQLIDIPATYLERRFGTFRPFGMPSAAESAAQTQADVNEHAQLDKPLLSTGAGEVGSIAGNIAGTMLPIGALSKVSPLAEALYNPITYRAAAAAGALQGALQPTTDGQSHLWNASLGTLGSIGGTALVNSVGRLAQPVKMALSAAQSKAVQVLEDAGINLDAAQKTGSVLLNKLRSGFMDNPVTAGPQAAMRQQQQGQFNRAVMNLIGENADSATPDVMGKAISRINNTMGDVLDRNVIPIDADARKTIGAITQEAASEIGNEQNPIAAQANRIFNAMDENGVVPGQTAYAVKKSLDRLTQSSDSTLKYHASQLKSTLMDVIHNSLTGDDQQAFDQSRLQFSWLKSVENSISKDGSGDISPSRLANTLATKRNRPFSIYGKGDQTMNELAHAGTMLLPDRNPNSGTTSRLMMQLGLPLLAGAGEGLYSGYKGEDFGDALQQAATTAAGVAVLPRVAQMAINNPAVSDYLARGAGGPLRDILMLPETQATIGGAARRLAARSATAPLSTMLGSQ